jgi:SWI/SNF-related matrix-associated actin-dependent regulator of chromatin subfamily A3
LILFLFTISVLFRSEDQQRVSTAVERGKVDPEDVPFSARTVDSRVISALAEQIQSTQKQPETSTSGLKRKHDELNVSSSQVSSSSIPSRPPASSQITDVIYLTDSSEEEETIPTKRPRLNNPVASQPASNQASGSRSGNAVQNLNANEASMDAGDLDNDEDANEGKEAYPVRTINTHRAQEEIYMTYPTEVVGVQYYDGMVGRGEEVDLIREPTNRYDSNAIQVINISGE